MTRQSSNSPYEVPAAREVVELISAFDRPSFGTVRERSEATRTQVLSATLDCLATLGHAGTTTVAVGNRAGVSRGALLHHFPTRAELIVAAVRRLFEDLDDRFAKAFARIPPDADRIDATIDLIWRGYASPKVPPLLELFVAARSDARMKRALRPVALEHRARLQRLAIESLAGSEPPPAFGEVLSLCFDAMQGMAMRRIIEPSAVEETLSAVKALLHQAVVVATARSLPDELICWSNLKLMELSYEAIGAERLADERAALDTFEAVAERPELKVELRLEPRVQ